MGNLYVALFTSAIGLSYFVYGKKAADFYFLLFGGLLMVYPYFVSNVVLSVIVGVILAACPFVIKRLF